MIAVPDPLLQQITTAPFELLEAGIALPINTLCDLLPGLAL